MSANSPSLFVNAATWGLVLTGRLVATTSEQSLSAALTRAIARSGEPIIRAGVDVAMRLMGEQFVTGRTIEEAINASREREARGFTFSYDMLGEAATTAEDAARYLAEYERAVHAIGRASHKRGIYEGPGVSIKLSALHPRYQRIKRGRVMSELLPRTKHLAALAKSYDIGLNVDAEEADRLDSRSTSSRLSASIPTFPAGTASASSSRPTASAASSSSTGSPTSRGARAGG